VGWICGRQGWIPIWASRNSDDLLRLDPFFHEATLFPLDANMQQGSEKWWEGILADNGSIYAIPYGANQVLEILFPELIKTNCAAYTGCTIFVFLLQKIFLFLRRYEPDSL